MNDNLDILQRDEYIKILKKIIDGISAGKKSSVFAIDGKWGIGKSFIIDKLNKEIDKSKYVVFNYNCWQYDYYEEPLVAIISNIQDNIQYCRKYYQKEFLKECRANKGMAAVYSTGNSVLKKFTGVDLQKIGENALSINKEYDKNNSFKKIITELQKHLKHITDTMPIIFIIDELDRCMPEYAIKVLERIHHIFHGFENVIVILSVDRMQLDYSIRKIFGDNTDIDGYLKKFVDFTIKIDNGVMSDNWQEKFSEDFFNSFEINGMDIVKNEIEPYLSLLNMREKEKIFKKINVINSSIKAKDGYILNEVICAFEVIYAVANEKFKYNNKLDWIREYILHNAHYLEYENISKFKNNGSHELDDNVKNFSSLIKKKHESSILPVDDGSFCLTKNSESVWYGLFYYMVLNERSKVSEYNYIYDLRTSLEFEKYWQTVEYVKKMYQLF